MFIFQMQPPAPHSAFNQRSLADMNGVCSFRSNSVTSLSIELIKEEALVGSSPHIDRAIEKYKSDG